MSERTLALLRLLMGVLRDGAALFYLLCFYQLLLGVRRRLGRRECLLLAAVHLAVSGAGLLCGEPGVRAALAAAEALFAACFFRGSVPQRLLAILGEIASALGCALAALGLTARALGCTMAQAGGTLYFDGTAAVLLALAGLVLLFAQYHRLGRAGQDAMTPAHWCAALAYPAAALACMLLLGRAAAQPAQADACLLLVSAVLLATLFVHFALVFLMGEQSRRLMQNQADARQMAQEKEKNEALLRAYTDQRRLTHEFRNQLAIAGELLREDKPAEAAAYIGGLLPRLEQGAAVVNTHNPVLDALIHYQYQRAAQQGTVMTFRLCSLAELPVDTQDMAVILSNLLENALEASAQEAAGEIVLQLAKDRGQLLLMVRNRTCAAPFAAGSRLPRSSKKEPGHGFGLRNVAALFQKYGAAWEVRCEDGWFQVTAVFDG